MDDFEAYVRSQSAALARAAYLLTGDRHHAEDLLQESLAKVAAKWPSLTRRGNPDAYVRRVMYNGVDRHVATAAAPAGSADRGPQPLARAAQAG